jgi:hypothetical protein
MNASVFVLDSPAWLSWASDAVYVACFFLGLFVIVVGCCIVAQIVTADTGLDRRIQTNGTQAPLLNARQLGLRSLRGYCLVEYLTQRK